MIDVLNRQVEFVVVMLGIAAILGAAVGQHPDEPDFLGLEELQQAVVQEIGSGDRGLAVIELGEGHLGVGIDEGLLVDPPHPFMLPT